MSTAWIYGVSGVHPWFMALLDDRAAQDVWGGDTARLICSSLMPAGKATATDGGFRLSGRWRYASCCCHCDWALLGGMVAADGGGPPHGRIFLVPRQDYEAVDTWQVAGLQGTGSWDVILDDVLVPGLSDPEHDGQFPVEGARSGGQHREPLPAAVRLDFRSRHLDRGARRPAGHAQRDAGLRQDPRDPRGRAIIGKPVRPAARRRDRGVDRRDAARAPSHVPKLHDYARRGETPPLDERLKYKFQSTWVTERCTLLASRIFKATGAAGLSDELPFGGILADLMAGRQHISNQFEYVGSNWGAAMFGAQDSKDLML